MRTPRSGRQGGRPMRIFTRDEATALLPRLIPSLEMLREAKGEVDQLRAELDALTPIMRGNGSGAEAARVENRLTELAGSVRRQVRKVLTQGVIIKDLDQGLIDFPTERDGRVVMLCWRLGEESISYWHEFDGGFAGRLPL